MCKKLMYYYTVSLEKNCNHMHISFLLCYSPQLLMARRHGAPSIYEDEPLQSVRVDVIIL